MLEQSLCPILVGRDAELSALEDALLAARRGAGGVVVVSGDAGAGKSRLCAELEQRARGLGMTVLHGGCSEADLALPYLPFLEAIGNHLASVDVGSLGERLTAVRRELAALFPQLGSGDAALPEAGDAAHKLRLFEALLALLGVLAEDGGLLLTVEDLHWADASTRELLDYLARRIRGNRVLLVANYRGDEMHRRHPLLPVVQGWRRSRLAEQVELRPLTVGQIGSMVGAIFDEDEVSEEFSAFLLDRCEGNPFVLEEMLKEAIDTGSIYRTPDGWERKALGEFRVPASVADGIMLRVDRLAPDAADVLRAAAVLGQTFDYSVLVAITGLAEDDVVTALRSCVQEQLLEEEPGAVGRYRFRHAITRESVYDDLILPERQRLHDRAAQALATLPDATAVDRATHLIAAGRWTEAVPLCLEAAQESSRRFAYRSAAELYERALPHVTDPVERTRVMLGLGEAYQFAGDPATALRYLEEGIADLDARGELILAAHYRLMLARSHWELSHIDVARSEYERARDDLEPEGPSEDLAIAYVRLAGMRAFTYDGDNALALAERAIAIAEAAGAELPRIWAYNFRGLGLLYSGRPDEGIAEIDRSLEEALAAGYDLIAANALHNTVITRISAMRGAECDALLDRHADRLAPLMMGGAAVPFLRGRTAQALGRLRQAEALYRETIAGSNAAGGVAALHSWATFNRAQLLIEFGDTDEARRLLSSLHLDDREAQEFLGTLAGWVRLHNVTGERDQALQVATRMLATGVLTKVPEWAPRVVEALTNSGRADDAARALDEYASPRVGWLTAGYGIVALARGDLTRARQELQTAVADFAAAGYRWDEALARIRLAEALAGSDDAAAREQLARATELMSETGAVVLRSDLEGVAARCGFDVPEQRHRRQGGDAGVDLSRAGERLVSVLFADVRGYTEMTATTPPAQMHERVATFQRWAQQEVERHHGVVDKFAGDAVMATFNVSGASIDHARHAFEAATALQDKAAAMGLRVGAGIAVGPAIVGALTPGANVSVLGETTNRAARLQANADGGEIVIDEEARRRLAGWLAETGASEREVRMELKGFADPVTAYVVSRGPAPA